eukprot:8852419-Karenia_brevis.AAC.1
MEIRISSMMLLGTWAQANREAASKSKLKDRSSSKQILRNSLRLPERPELLPFRERRSASPKC